MRFSTKLTILFSIILLIIGSVVLYAVYTSNLGLIERNVTDKLKSGVHNYALSFDRMLFERSGDIKILASDAIISNRKAAPGEITERLNAFKMSYPLYASLSFFDRNGRRVADTDGKNIGKRYQGKMAWPCVKAGEEPVVGMGEDESIGEMYVYFAAAVFDVSGLPVGVVVSRIAADRLFSILDEKANETGIVDKAVRLTVVDNEGRILFTRYKDAADNNKLRLQDWDDIKRLIDGDAVGAVRRRNIMGEDVVTAFASERGFLSFKSRGWTLLYNYPVEVLYRDAREMRNRILLIFMASAAVGLIAIYVFSRRLSVPITRLRDAAVDVSAGNLDVSVSCGLKDEIGDLTNSFNDMVKNLKFARDRFLVHSRELEESRANLVEAQSIARIGNIYLDADKGIVSGSRETCRIFGSEECSEKGCTFDAFLLMVHHEDRDILETALINAAVDDNVICETDFRVSLPDGVEKIIYIRARSRADGAGGRILAGTVQDITERKKLENELKRLASTDALTQANNRLKFVEVISSEMKLSARYGRPLAIAIFDIDFFKSVNDRYGHSVGDYVLKTVVSVIKENMRETNQLFRWGGEEFVVTMPETDIEGAVKAAERLRVVIEEYSFDAVGAITASFGVTGYKVGDTEDTFLTRGDAALYKAKMSGRNRVEFI